MIRILKLIRNLLIIFILFGIATAFVDYSRMITGLEPIFNISTYNNIKHIEKYRGLFYQASRETKVNEREPLKDSSDIKYYVLTKEINISNNFSEVEFNYKMKFNKASSCEGLSSLYFADEKIKVYSYCFNDLSIIDENTKKEDTFLSYLKKDSTMIEDIIQNMNLTGLNSDSSIEVLKSDEELSDDRFIIYRCNKPDINDVYIVPNGIDVMDDFCTYKDDDFKFLAVIEEEKLDSETTEEKQKEVFYEDDSYYYEFDEPKKDRIFISAPAVRLTPEKKYSLMDVLNNNILTIDELEEIGLKFNKVQK